MARQDRFTPDILQRVQESNFNPYFGVPRICEIEEKYGIRSTFFFRPIYDDGSPIAKYSETLRDLRAHGWEVGLHANNTATQRDVEKEKSLVEQALGASIAGCRIHCLYIQENTYPNLKAAGIKYDSSISYDKHTIDPKNTGCFERCGVTVFPITYMDAYLFTYMKQTEESIVPYIIRTATELYESGVELLTLLWHDNAVMMKGGRVYPKLVEELTALDITFLTGNKAYQIIQERKRETQ